jgi:glycosyltransferase involved in cell wall biosynthesis
MVGVPAKEVAPNGAIPNPMIHLFINALSASAGGGLTYIRNVLPVLSKRDDVRVTLCVSGTLGQEVPDSTCVTVIRESFSGGSGQRFWYEQRRLPELIRRSGANVLLSTGNFALFLSPVPQILLSRNALYISRDFFRDVRERGDYRLWLDTKIKGEFAKWSIKTADCTVAPSETFARDLRQWTGREVVCIHHGFDSEAFFHDRSPLPERVQARLEAGANALKILFVSHYNYYRNFETLIRAIGIAKGKLHGRPVRLFLTCKLDSKENPGNYQAAGAAELVRQLKLTEEVVELGPIPYASLHHLYRSCDLYATPAYAETFAHPLVEAMASGLPVIASDLTVHREICGDAASYFPRFSAEALAESVLQLSAAEPRRAAMRTLGRARSEDFRWAHHVEALVRTAEELASPQNASPLHVR